MSPTLNKIKVHSFARVIKQNPQLLTCNSYMNFLRYYKTQHPRLDLRKLLQNGFKEWLHLKPGQRKKFKQKNIEQEGDIMPRLKWSAKSAVRKVPRRRMPRSYKKRHLNSDRNIKRHNRNKKRLLRYGRKQFPGHFN